MSEHGTYNSRRVHPKPREKGAAHAIVHHHRRHKSMEGKYGYIGDGVTITGATVDTSGTYPGVVLDSFGLHAYNASGTETFFVSASDGSLTVIGGGTITGGTIRTSSTFPYVIFDSSGIRSYNVGGVLTFNLNSADGSLTVTGASTITGGTIRSSSANPRTVMDASGFRAYNAGGTNTITVSASDGSVTVNGGTITGAVIQTAAASPRVLLDTAGIRAYSASLGQTVNIGSDGTFWFNTSGASLLVSSTGINFNSQPQSASGARVMIDSTGIKGYNASNQQEFLLDAASGLIVATGLITANPGSTVPWQTTGFFIGGGNQLSNSSGEDPSSSIQILYSTTTSITAGTFTLQYGASGTLTTALPYNATGDQVQAALNTTGILPSGVVATCTGGPLPQLPVTISLAGFSTVAPLVLTVVNSSMVGGSMVTGQVATGWTTSAGVMDVAPYSQAYHGGQVFRLTNSAAFSSFPSTTSYPSTTQYPGATVQTRPVVSQIIGPYGLVPGTAYTLSGYFSAVTAARSPQGTILYLDIQNNVVATASLTSSWTTTANWQRLVLTEKVPPAYTRQEVAASGSPTGGSFTLSYNGQTTAAIVYNATAAQVLSALQALSNVGTSGVSYATGGPLPGNPVYVSFVSPPAASPASLTATSSLTGGTSPGIQIYNMQPVYVQSQITVPALASGETVYMDAVQLEVGDAPTAFAPRGDEILANTIQANMINVAQLSAISANLGTITAGTVTGATLQTATSGARVVMNNSGLFGYDATNTPSFSLTGAALSITGGTITSASITSGSISGGTISGTSVTSSTVTSSTVTSSTVTGSTIQTSASDPRTTLDSSGFWISNSSGTKVVGADHTHGFQVACGTGILNGITWVSGSVGGTSECSIWSTTAPQLNMASSGGPGSTTQSGAIAMYTSSLSVGTAPVTAGSFNVASSSVLKRDWEHLDPQDILSRIGNLPVGKFRWASGPQRGRTNIGAIAEDFVGLFSPGIPTVSEEGTPSIPLSDLSAISLLGVKALTQRVEDLESHLEVMYRALESSKSIEEFNSEIRRSRLKLWETQHFLETINPQSETRKSELERRITQHKEAVA